MHIPDGFLSPEIWIGLWLISIAILAYAVAKTNKKLGDRHVPLMGVLAAFIFAAQMLNTPVAAGTSGHMLGGVLAAVFLGPLAGSIIMTSVFIVQAVFFQDGGITTLGANIFNMGLIGTIGGYYIYRVIGRFSGRLAAAGIAAWLAVVLASAATSIELAVSGTTSLQLTLAAMVGIHAIIGLIEAGITVGAIAFVMKTRPDLLKLEKI